MSKVYVVRIGRVPGIYKTWTECQKNVTGFSGAVYKSFSSLEEAESFLHPEKRQIIGGEKIIDIYTDGSHQRSRGYLGIGAWCLFGDKEYSLSLTVSADLLLSYGIVETKVSNPTAELIAFAEVLKRLENTPKGYILQFHADYLGVKYWIEGTWKAKETYIQKIRDICHKRLQKMGAKVLIFHVAGHSGNIGNDKADSLAGNVKETDEFHSLMTLLV